MKFSIGELDIFDRHRRPFVDKIPESSRFIESGHRDRDN